MVRKRSANNIKGAGRNSLWFELDMPSHLEAVEGWAKQGAIDTEICEFLGISKPTFYKWKKEYPEFSAALKKGKHIANGELVNAAFRNATGHYVRVTEPVKLRDEMGAEHIEMVTYDKYIPANATQNIFMMKNRMPEHYRDRQEVKHEGQMGVTIIDDIGSE